MKRFILMGGNQFGSYIIGFAGSKEEAEELLKLHKRNEFCGLNTVLIDCETRATTTYCVKEENGKDS